MIKSKPAPPPLILASASPRRSELLAGLGAQFEVIPAMIEEDESTDADPHSLVMKNASLKAEWVAAKRPEALVLGADTTVFLEGVVFHKPADRDDARRMLGILSGKAHSVFTGMSLRCVDRGVHEDTGVESRVVFRNLDDALIDRYLDTAVPLDKAGAYGIQDYGEMIIERWEGSFTNIVGLPVEVTKEILTRHGLLPS